MAELYRRRFPATPEAVPLARHDVVDVLARAGLTDAGLHTNIALAVSEATGNAVRHAYPPDRSDGQVEVSVTRTTDGLVVTVRDEGSGMDQSMSTDGAGLGLSIMGAQTRNLAIESDGSGTVVRMSFTV